MNRVFGNSRRYVTLTVKRLICVKIIVCVLCIYRRTFVLHRVITNKYKLLKTLCVVIYYRVWKSIQENVWRTKGDLLRTWGILRHENVHIFSFNVLGCDAIWTREWLTTFRRNELSSWGPRSMRHQKTYHHRLPHFKCHFVYYTVSTFKASGCNKKAMHTEQTNPIESINVNISFVVEDFWTWPEAVWTLLDRWIFSLKANGWPRVWTGIVKWLVRRHAFYGTLLFGYRNSGLCKLLTWCLPLLHCLSRLYI